MVEILRVHDRVLKSTLEQPSRHRRKIHFNHFQTWLCCLHDLWCYTSLPFLHRESTNSLIYYCRNIWVTCFNHTYFDHLSCMPVWYIIHHKSKDGCNLNQSVVKKLHSFVKLGSSCRRLKISISGEIWCFSPDNSQQMKHKFYACALSETVYTPLKTSIPCNSICYNSLAL